MVAERWKRLRPGDPAMVAGAAIYRDQGSACHGSKRSWHSAAASITGESRARPPCGCTDTYSRWVAAVPAAWPLTRSELRTAYAVLRLAAICGQGQLVTLQRPPRRGWLI